MLNNYEDTSSGFTNSHVQTPASIPRSVETQKQQNIGPTWSYNSQLEGLYSCYQNEHQPVYNIHSMGHFEGNTKHSNNPYPQYSTSSLHQPVPTPIGKCHEACCQHLSERYPINPAPLRYPPNGSVQPPRYGEISSNDHRQYFTERRPMQTSISRKKEFQSENGYSNASHDRHFQFVGRGQIHVPERQSMQMIRSQYPMYPINSYWSPRNWSGPRMSYPPPPPYHQSVTNQTNQLQNNLKMGEPPHYIDSSVSKSLSSQQRRAIMRNANANPEIVRPIPETKRQPGNGSHVQGCYDFPYHSGFVPFNEVNKMSSNIPSQVNSASCKLPLDKQFQQHQFKISNNERSMSGCNNPLGEIAYTYPPESYMRNPSNGLQQMTDSRKLSLQYEQQSLGKKRPDLDVRQFLATWDDDEEDSTRISEPIHNSNLAPYIVVDCRSLEGEAAAKLQERLKGTSTQNFQSKSQNESPNSLNNVEPKGTGPNDIILRDSDPQRSLMHSEYAQGSYGSAIHVDSDKNLPFWNPESRENCPETDTIMGKGAFQPLDCTKRDNMNVVEPLGASKRDSHMHGDMNHKLINNDSTNHMSFDALVTYYGDSRRAGDGSYDLVEMTERLVNASDKICTIERNQLEQEMPGEGLHPCDPRNLQNQLGPNQTTYHHRLPSRYTSNNYQHYKSGISNDTFFNFKYPVGSSKFFGFDSSNLDPNFDYHKTQAEFVHQKSMLTKDKVIDNFQNNSISKNLSKVDLQDVERRGNVMDPEILKKQHSLNNYQIPEKSNLDFVGVDPEQFITPIIIKKSDYYNKENDGELKITKINNDVMGQGSEKNVLMQSNNVENDILKISHSSSNKHLFRETNVVTLHSGDQAESNTITVEVPYDEQYSSLVKLSEEITESSRNDSNMQENDDESKVVRSQPDSKDKNELPVLKKPTSFKLKRLPNSKEWIKIGGDVNLESNNCESKIHSDVEKNSNVQDAPKPVVNLNMPSLDDIRFNDESENKSDNNALSSLKVMDKNSEELSTFPKFTNNENKGTYKSDNITQLAIVSPMKFSSEIENDIAMRTPSLAADDTTNHDKDNFNSSEKNFITSDSQISNLTVQSKELEVNAEFTAMHSPYNTIVLEEHAQSPFMEMNHKLQNTSDTQSNDDINTFISESTNMEHNYSDVKKLQSTVTDAFTADQCLDINNDEILCSGNTEHDNKESFSSFHNYSESEMNSTMTEYFKLNNRMCNTDKDMEVCIPSSPGVEEMFEDINHANNNDNEFLGKPEEILFVPTRNSPVSKGPCCGTETSSDAFNSDAFIMHDSVDERCSSDLPLDTTNGCSLNFNREGNDEMFSKPEQPTSSKIENNLQQNVKTCLNFIAEGNDKVFSKSEQSESSKIEENLQQNVKTCLNFDAERNDDIFSKSEQPKNSKIEDDLQQNIKTCLSFEAERNDEIFSKSEQSKSSKIEESFQQNVKTLPVIPPINLKLNERKKIWCIAKKPKSFDVKPISNEAVGTKENKICHENETECQNTSCNYNRDCDDKTRNVSQKFNSDLDSESLPTPTNMNDDLNCFPETTNEANKTIDLSLQNESNKTTASEEEPNENKEEQERVSIFNTFTDLKDNDRSIDNSTFLCSELSVQSNSSFSASTEKDHKGNENTFKEDDKMIPQEKKIIQLRENLDHESMIFHENKNADSKADELAELKEPDNADIMNLSGNSLTPIPSTSTKDRKEDEDFLTNSMNYMKEMSQNLDSNYESNNKHGATYPMLNLSYETNASTTAVDVENITENIDIVKSNSQGCYLKLDESAKNDVISSSKSFSDDKIHINNMENPESLSADFTTSDKDNSCFNIIDGQNDCDLFENTVASNTKMCESVDLTEINVENRSETSQDNDKECPIGHQSKTDDAQINAECQKIEVDVGISSSEKKKVQNEKNLNDCYHNNSVDKIEMFETHKELQETVNCQTNSKLEILTEEDRNLDSTSDFTFQKPEKCAKSSTTFVEEEESFNITTNFNLESISVSEHSRNSSPHECNVQEKNFQIYPILKCNKDNKFNNSHTTEHTENSTLSTAVSDLIESVNFYEPSENNDKILTIQEEICSKEYEESHPEPNPGMKCSSSNTVKESYIEKQVKNNVELCCSFESGEDKNLQPSESHEIKKNILDTECTSNKHEKSETILSISLDNNDLLLSPKISEHFDNKEIVKAVNEVDVIKDIHIEDVNRQSKSKIDYIQNTTIQECNNKKGHGIQSEIQNNSIKTSDNGDCSSSNKNSINTHSTDIIDPETVLINQEVSNMNGDSLHSITFLSNQKLKETVISNSFITDETTVKGESMSAKQNLDVHEDKGADEEITIKVNDCCRNVENEKPASVEPQEDYSHPPLTTKENKDQKNNSSLKESEKYCDNLTDISNEVGFETSVDQNPVNPVLNVNNVNEEIEDVRKCYEGTEIEYSSEELNFGINYETCTNQATDIVNSSSTREDILTNERIKSNSDIENNSKDNCDLMKDDSEMLLSQRKAQDKHENLNTKNCFDLEDITDTVRKELEADESKVETLQPLNTEISTEINNMQFAEAKTLVSDCVTDLDASEIFENRKPVSLVDVQTKVSRINPINPLSNDFCTNCTENMDNNIDSDKSIAKYSCSVLSKESNKTEELEVKNAEILTELNHSSQVRNDTDNTDVLLSSEGIEKDQNIVAKGENSMASIGHQNSSATESITTQSKPFSEREHCTNKIDKINTFSKESNIENDKETKSTADLLDDKEKNINLVSKSNIVDCLSNNNNYEFITEDLEENDEKCDDGFTLKPTLTQTQNGKGNNCKELASNFEPNHFKFNNPDKCIKNESKIPDLKLNRKTPIRKIFKNQSLKSVKKQKISNILKDYKNNVNSKNVDEFVRHPDTLLFKVEKRESEMCDNKAVKVKLNDSIVSSNAASQDTQLETGQYLVEANRNVNKLSDFSPIENQSNTSSNLDDHQTVTTPERYKEKDDNLQRFNDDIVINETIKHIPVEEQTDSPFPPEYCNSNEKTSTSDFLSEETVEKQMEAMHSSHCTYSNENTEIIDYHNSPIDSSECNFTTDNEVKNVPSLVDKPCSKEIFTGETAKDDNLINKSVDISVNEHPQNIVQPISPSPAAIPRSNRTECSEHTMFDMQCQPQLNSCTFYNTQFNNDLLLNYETQLNRTSVKQMDSNSSDMMDAVKIKRRNSILSNESISNMIKVQDIDTTPFQCLVEAALAVETAEKANKMAIENSSKTCVENDSCDEINQDFKEINETQLSVNTKVYCNTSSSLPDNVDFNVNKKKTKTKYRFPKPKIKTKKLKKNVAKSYLNENDCSENLKNVGGKATCDQDNPNLDFESLTKQKTETIEKINTESISPNTDVHLKTDNKSEYGNCCEEYKFETNNLAQSDFSDSKSKATQHSISTGETTETIECGQLESDVLYFHVNSEKVNEYVEEFNLKDIKVLSESQQLKRDGLESEIDGQENLKLSNLDLETETNFVIIIEELETAESSEEFMEKGINIQNIVANCGNLEETIDVDGTQVPVEIIATPENKELSTINVLDSDSFNNTELDKIDNTLDVSHQVGYDGLNANLSNDIANWPYVEEEVTYLDNNLETDKDIFLANSNLISSIKCSLPWERIFNISNTKKRKIKHNKQMFSPNGLELGPAKIELRLASESGGWKVVTNKNNDSISPIVNVKRLILQRDPELSSYSEKESEEEVDLKERRQSLGQCSDDSSLKVNKKIDTDNSNMTQITKDKRWQPVVVLTRDKELDELCLDIKEHDEQFSRCDSSSNSPYSSGVSKLNKKIKRKRKSSMSQRVNEKKTRNENLQKNEGLEFTEADTFSQNPDKDDHFSFTDSIDPAQEYVWRCLDNEDDWMDRSPLQHYCDEKSENDSFDEDQISFNSNERRNSFTDNYSFIDDSSSKRMPENGDIIETEYVNSKSKDWKHLQDSESTCSKESIIGARKSDLLHNLSLIFSKNRNRGVKRPSEGHSKEDTKRRRRQKIEKYPFHCRKCCIGFKMKEEMVRHKDSRHPPHRELHHCLLCQRSFSTSLRHSLHVEGRSHRHLELVQRHTMHAVHNLLTSVDFPRIRPLSNSERLALDWRPNQPGCIHYYHQLTPLQAALQDYSTNQETNDGHLEINKKA